MAVTSPAPALRPRQHLLWSRLHFVLRLFGLTGALFACTCGVFAGIQGQLQPLSAVADVRDAGIAGLRLAQTAVEQPADNLALMLFLAGATAALVALLVELFVVLGVSATSRSAFGFNAVVQGTLAALVLVAVNVWSFSHYERIDFTRDQQFTLPPQVRADLARLDPRSQTTIIVYNRHKVFASQKDTLPDDYDAAAERKVIDKVRDLVEQFRGSGPQIKVEVLDTQARDYNFKERLRELSEAAVRGSRAAEEQPSGERAGQEAADAAALRKTIESAPENSLFFCGRDNKQFHVQQLSFNDFYLLDKNSGQTDRDGRGNLVLLYQGVEPFANRLMRLGQKKPRIAIATIHELLSTENPSEIGLRGLRAALEARGFEVKDVILKKFGNGPGGLEPVVYSFDESKLDGLKRNEQLIERNIRNLKQARAETLSDREDLAKAAENKNTRTSFLKQIAENAPEQAQDLEQKVRLLELAIRQRREALDRPEISEDAKTTYRRDMKLFEELLPQITASRDLWKKAVSDEKARETLLNRDVKERLDDYDKEVQEFAEAIQGGEQRLAKTRADKSKMNVAALEEQQQMTDLQAKLQHLLADCDLVMVPRMTLINTASGEGINPRAHTLDKTQVEAVKEFLKTGKPILACFGPLNTPTGIGREEVRPDELEEALEQLGVKFGKQTILFDAEEQGFGESRAGLTIAGASVEVPPLIWDWSARQGQPPGSEEVARPSNRIRDSIRLTARGLGKGVPLDLRLRDPRPIYYLSPQLTDQRRRAVQMIAPLAQLNWATATVSLSAFQKSLDQRLSSDPVFLMTSAQSWNEDNPFAREGRVPQFEQPKRDKDKRRQLKPPATGLDTRRRGPFPIGVAVETSVPRSWYNSESDKPARLRLAVIGQGGFFAGKELPDAQEKVLVHTINWLLGRDDRLPRDERTWSYPRVNDTIPPDSPTEYLWLWGIRLGLPALFVYLGCVVWLFRRLR